MRIPRSLGIAALAGAGVTAAAVARRRATRGATGPVPEPVPGVPVAAPEPVPGPKVLPSPPTADDGARAGRSDPEATFRPDVEGLRGVAILLVLLFHGAFPIPGGFIGVDVFFVISGFLITGMLVREIARTGSIALDRFYARRIRRLLPAAVVVLAVTLPISYVVLAPLDRGPAMTDGVAAMLSTANLRFALAEGDYFAAVSSPSPFLHFWSLALEEQFYLLWPLLLLVVARGRRPGRPAAAALAVLGLASFAAGVVLTEASATWGFYLLPGRAWQFAAGGLLAMVAGLIPRVPARLVAMAGWSGAAILAVSALTIDGGVPYPGFLAVAPTIAAVLLIAGGQSDGGPGRLLTVTPLRSLGRISYSLYLWHWPILVLPAIAFGASLEPPLVIALTAVAIVVGWVSERSVERRFRRPLPRERRATRRSLAFGVAAIAAVVGFAGSLDLAAASAIAGEHDATVAATFADAAVTADDAAPVVAAGEAEALVPVDDGATGSPVVVTATTTPGAVPTSRPATGPTTAPSAMPAPTAVPRPDPAAWVLDIPAVKLRKVTPLPRDVHPSLAGARGDIERLFADGCITNTFETRPARCVYGNAKGSTTIALVGDSHASHWFPAFNVLAKRHGWRLVPFVKVACPFVDMPVGNLTIKRTYTECATWRDQVIDRVNRDAPDLVVVISGHRAIIATRAADASPERQGAAMAHAIDRLESPVAVMIDSPRASYDIPACLSRHRDDVRACAIPRDQAFPDQFGVRERIAAASSGSGLLDLVAEICPSTPCQVVRDGHILYRDNHHLTATFVRSLADELDAALAPHMSPPPAAAPLVPLPGPPAPEVR